MLLKISDLSLGKTIGIGAYGKVKRKSSNYILKGE